MTETTGVLSNLKNLPGKLWLVCGLKHGFSPIQRHGHFRLEKLDNYIMTKKKRNAHCT
jgi:hypothetical protein